MSKSLSKKISFRNLLLLLFISFSGGFSIYFANTTLQKQQNLHSKAVDNVINLPLGTQLFVDDYLIAAKSGVSKMINKPHRYGGNPVISNNADFRNAQPFMSVIKDSTGFKMWYNAATGPAELDDPTAAGMPAAYVTSSDGITWNKPLTRNNLIDQTYVFNVIDEGASFSPSSERYKQIYSSIRPKPTSIPTPTPTIASDADWLLSRIAVSANGTVWTPVPGVKTLIPGYGHDIDRGNQGDILELYKNPVNNRYGFFNRYYGKYRWQSKDWSTTKEYIIRRVGYMISDDFKSWKNPLTGTLWSNAVLFSPDNQDYGVTEWYGGPTDVRNYGGLLLGFLKVLRDDLSAPGIPDSVFTTCSLGDYAKGGAGVGYSVLAWSRDNGITWQRDRASTSYLNSADIPKHCIDSKNVPHDYTTRYADINKISSDPNVFFAPDPIVGAFDHAHAWIDEMVEVGNQDYFYYGGYKYGHKSGERQIGLATLTKDRFVYYDAGNAGGSIITPLFKTSANKLFINADAAMGKYLSPGEIKVSIIDTANNVTVCNTISGGDHSHTEIICPKSFASFANTAIKLKFDLIRTGLFAFYLENSGTVSSTPTKTLTPTVIPTRTPTLSPTPTPTRIPTPTALPVTPTSTPIPTATSTPIPTPTTLPPAISLNKGVGGNVVIDGSLSEFVNISPFASFADTVVKGFWNDNGIYLGYEILDDQLSAVNTPSTPACQRGSGSEILCKVWTEDSVEWYVDVLGDDGGESNRNYPYMKADDFQGLININNAIVDLRGDNTTFKPTFTYNGNFRSMVIQEGTRVFIEVEIPWSSLLTSSGNTAGRTIKLGLARNDLDGSLRSGYLWGSLGLSYQNASNWQNMLVSTNTVNLPALPTSEPTPTSPPLPGTALNIARATETVTVDGNLAEYTSVNPILFSSAKVYPLWDSQGLYLGYDVTDNFLEVVNSPFTCQDKPENQCSVWNDDSVEWFVDSKNNKGGQRNRNKSFMRTDDYQGIVNLANARVDLRGQFLLNKPSFSWNGSWQSAVTIDYTNYTVEVFIPWETIRVTNPQLGYKFGLGLAINDRDFDKVVSSLWGDLGTSHQNASNWVVAKLSELANEK